MIRQSLSQKPFLSRNSKSYKKSLFSFSTSKIDKLNIFPVNNFLEANKLKINTNCPQSIRKYSKRNKESQ